MNRKILAAVLLSPFWLSTPVRAVNPVALEGGTPQAHAVEKRGSQGIIYNPPLFEPPDEGASPTTAGGGTRGPLLSCLKDGKSIIPLLPKNNFGLTVSQYPTFFLYIPESTAQEARLVLREPDKDAPIYDTTLHVPSQPGIVRLSLPNDAALPPLKEGKTYHWYLSLVCGTEDSTKYGRADGWIERIAPSVPLTNELKKASLPDRPKIYGKAGIWQETLTTLAELRSASPNNLALVTDWEALLTSVGLDAVAKQPLILEQESQSRQEREGTSEQDAKLTISAKLGEGQKGEGVRLRSTGAIFEPPIDGGATPSTAGGGTRGGSCISKGKSIIPLIPSHSSVLTVSEYPTFYSYIPESTAKTASFVLQEQGQDDDAVYETTFNIPRKAGIVSVGLPKTALSPLKVGKMYHWFFLVECDPEDNLQNAIADGWIKRIEPSTTLLNELKKTSLRDQPRVYGKAGIWQDTLVTLAQLRRAHPDDSLIVADWEDLLTSVGLDAVAKEPLILEQEIPNRHESERKYK